jgi:hypothetical protein
MKTFLQRFAGLVAGVLSGFDRLVFRGKLRQLYAPDGMDRYLAGNHILFKNYKEHAESVTRQVIESSVAQAARLGRPFEYLDSPKIPKDERALQVAKRDGVKEGLICVFKSLEPCWSFKLMGENRRLHVAGRKSKCSFLYHYFLHPEFGLMYGRVQTWFPFEIQVGINGREWLARQLDRAGVSYLRSDNKFLEIEDWQRAQQLLDQQVYVNWVPVLEDLLAQVHPLHPKHLGSWPLAYNWTVFQSEWATDVAFQSAEILKHWYDRWIRHALMNFDSTEVLRFLGFSGRLNAGCRGAVLKEVKTNLRHRPEGVRLKHWVDDNSLKMYDHHCVLRVETTINEPRHFRLYRTSENDPDGEKAWRVLRRNVADIYRRTQVSQAANQRYLGALATVAETRPLKELTAPLCRRAPAPGKKPGRKLRALNPLAADDAALLAAVADPRWMINGVRNRDLVAALYKNPAADPAEQRRRSSRVTRLIRLLRAHALLQKVPRTHRYQVSDKARQTITVLLAARDANPEELIAKAA